MKTYVFSDEHNCDHTYVLAADAQRALDAEREKVAKLEKIQAIDLKNNNEYREQLATLQAQLADRDAMILQMGEQAAVLAKENMAVKAQLRQVEGQSQQQAEEAVIVFAKYTTLRQLVAAKEAENGKAQRDV